MFPPCRNSIVRLVSDKLSAKPHKLPVIAWEIDQRHDQDGEVSTVVCPVTIEGTDKKSAIVFPDGGVNTAMGDYYPSVSMWLKSAVTTSKGGGRDDVMSQ